MALITLKEWAARVGIEPATARQKAIRGAIPAEKIGRDWYIDDNVKNPDGRKNLKQPEKIAFDIIGESPFGCGFISSSEEGYRKHQLIMRTKRIYAEYAQALIGVVRQYGGKPCCQIKHDDITIDVYKCNFDFCFSAHYNGWQIDNPYVYLNTVNPEAIVRWFIDERRKLIESGAINLI